MVQYACFSKSELDKWSFFAREYDPFCAFGSVPTCFSLARARAGSTILPAMALAGAHTSGMRVTPLPSLGTRKILLRHKNHGWSEAGGPARVVAFLAEWQRHNAYSAQTD